eukprot:Amastigsp_a685426_3.p2 type:complete len:151 gc:universal Amastigsp_a685426_3:99-551(+)
MGGCRRATRADRLEAPCNAREPRDAELRAFARLARRRHCAQARRRARECVPSCVASRRVAIRRVSFQLSHHLDLSRCAAVPLGPRNRGAFCHWRRLGGRACGRRCRGGGVWRHAVRCCVESARIRLGVVACRGPEVRCTCWCSAAFRALS